MANRFWVGGTGTWNTTTTNWSATSGGAGGASAPTAADAVFFDQAGTYTVTLSGTLNCESMTVSAGTVTIAGTSGSLTVAGNMTLLSGTVWSATIGITFTCATNTTGAISAGGTVINSPITLNTVTGGRFGVSTTDLVVNNTFTLTSGQLILQSNLSVTTFNTAGATARSIAFSTFNITLTGSGTVLSMAVLGGFTYTGTGGFLADASVVRTYSVGSTSGGATTNALRLTFTGSGTAIPVLTTGSWFNKLDFGTTAFTLAATSLNLLSLTLSSGGTFTNLTPTMLGAGTITSNGNTTLAVLTINNGAGITTTLGDALTLTATSTVTLTSGSVDLAGFTLSTGIFSSNNSGTRAVAFGSGTIALTHTTAATTVLSMATATGFTWTGTGGFTTSATVARAVFFGSTAGGTATNAPNITITGTGTSVISFATGSWFNTLSFGTTAFNPGTTALSLSGLTLSSGGTFSTLTPTMVGTGTITSNGNTTLAAMTINSTSGTTTLGDAFTFTATSTVTLTTGTLALAGFTMTTGIFSSNNANTRAISFGSGTIALAHTTAAQTVLSMATVTGFTVSGTGGFTTTAATTRTINFGSAGVTFATNAPNLTLTGSGTSVITFAALTTNTTLAKLDFGTTAFNPGTVSVFLSGLTLSSGGTFSTFTPTMVGTGTLTGNGNATLAAVFLSGTSTTTTLGSALTLTATGTFTINSGGLDLGGFTLTTGIFSSSNTATRSIAFGSSSIVLAHTTAATTVLSMATATGFTRTGTGGFTTTAAITRTIVFGTTGGSTTNAPNLTLTGSGTAVITFTTASWFGTLDFGTTAFNPGTTALSLNGLVLSTGGTFSTLTPTIVGTGPLTGNGNTTLPAVTINSTSGTTTLGSAFTLTATGTFTLTSGTLDLGGFTLTTGIFSSTGAVTRAIAFGSNNIVLAHTTAAQTVLSMANATNFTWTGTGGFTTTAAVTRTLVFGTTGGTYINAPNLALTGSGTAVLTFTTGSWFDILDFGTTAFAVPTTTINIAGNLILSSGGTFTGLSPTFVGTITLNSSSFNGKTVATIGVNNGPSAGTVTFSSAINSSSGFTLTSGTVDFASFDLTVSGTVSYVAGTFLNIGTINCATFSVTGTFTLTQGTIAPSTSFVLVSGAFNYNGGTLSPVPTFTHTAGTVTLGQAYALTATGTYTLTAGTLNLNGFGLTTGIFASTSASTRAIAFGSNNIILGTTTAATTVLSMATATGFTYTGTGGFVTDASVTRTLVFGTTGGTTTNSPNVTFTGSGASALTLTTGSFFNTLDFGSVTSTVGTTSLTVENLYLSPGGNFSGLTVLFTAASTINANGNTTLGALTVNGSGVTLTLLSNLTMSATSTTTLTLGTLALGGFNLSTGIFSSDNSNTRAISFGTGNITLTHTTADTVVLNMVTATGFTWTGTGGFTSNMDNTRTFSFGGLGGATAATAINLALTGGSATATITLSSWFNLLDFTGSTSTVTQSSQGYGIYVNTLTLATGGEYTGLRPIFTKSTAWTAQFGKQLGGIGIYAVGGTLTLDPAQTYVATSTLFLIGGTIDLSNNNLTFGSLLVDVAVTAIAFGTGSLTLATPTAATTVLSVPNFTNFSFTGSGQIYTDAAVTRTFSCGNVAGGNAADALNVTWTGSGTAVATLTTGGWFQTLDFGTTAFALGTTSLNVFGVNLATGGTYNALTLTTVGTGTITTSGKTIAALTINCPSGTTTLGSALSFTAGSATTTLTAGTLDLAGFTLTTGIFSSSNTNTRAITFGSANIVLAHGTAANTVLSMATATGFTNTGTGGFTADASITRTYTFGTTGGTATNAPNLTLTGSGSAAATFTTGGWFQTLNFGTTATTVPATVLNVNTLYLSAAATANYLSFSPTMVGTGTITTNGKTLAAFTVNNVAGTTTMLDAISMVTPAVTTLTSGTLDLGGFTLTTGSFSSNNANTRSIIFGSANIVLLNTAGGATLTMTTATGFTWTGTGGFTVDANTPRTFTFGTTGGTATNAPNLTFTGSNVGIPTLATGSWFGKLDFGTTAFALGTTSLNLSSLYLSSGGTFTSLTATMVGTGTITSNAKTIATFTVNNVAGTTTLLDAFSLVAIGTTTLTSGTLDLGGFTLTTGSFSSSNTNTRAITFGSGNIVLAHTTAATTVLAMATATGFTWTGTGGFAADASITRGYTFGTTGGTATNAPNLSLTGSGVAIATITTASWFKTLNFGTTAFTLGTTSLNLSGLYLSSTGTYTGLSAVMVGTGTITPNGKQISTITITNPSGTTTLAGALALTTTTTFNSGTLDLSGFGVTGTQLTSTGAATARTITGGGGSFTLSLAGAAWNVTNGAGFTGSNYTINLTAATAKSFAGGGGTYGSVVQAGAGALTFSGSNTLEDLTATTRPSSIIFTASTTTTFTNFNLSGAAAALVTITSTVSGTQATFSKASGNVSPSYINIKDNNATGGATWFLNNTNVNSGNLTGWVAGTLAALTGVFGSGFVQAVLAASELSATCVEAAGFTGTVDNGGSQVQVVGNEAALVAGNTAAQNTNSLTYVEATGEVNAPTVSQDVAATGVEASGAVSVLGPEFYVSINTVVGDGAVGDVSATPLFSLSSVLASGLTGDVSVSSLIGVTGVLADGAAGTVAPTKAFTLTGAEASGFTGTFDPVLAGSMAGVQAAGDVGTLQFGYAYGLTGVSASGLAGTLSFGYSFPITGVTVEGFAGDVLQGKARDLTGVSASGFAGTFSWGVSFDLTGTETSGSLGSYQLATTRSVTGTSAQGSVGTMAFGYSYGLTGVQSSGVLGTLLAGRAYSITGVAAAGELGAITPGKGFPITGTGATGTLGTLLYGKSFGLTGVLASGVVQGLILSQTTSVNGVLTSGTVGIVVGDRPDKYIAITSVQALGTLGYVIGNIPDTYVAITGVQLSGEVGDVLAVYWAPVDDEQIPDWQSEDITQVPEWAEIDVAQTPDWNTVDTVQAPTWDDQTTTQDPVWGIIETSQ